jgi:hypothetical protein
LRCLALAQALAGELDPIGVVHDPIEHGVGKRRDGDDVIPAVDGSWLVIRREPAS